MRSLKERVKSVEEKTRHELKTKISADSDAHEHALSRYLGRDLLVHNSINRELVLTSDGRLIVDFIC